MLYEGKRPTRAATPSLIFFRLTFSQAARRVSSRVVTSASSSNGDGADNSGAVLRLPRSSRRNVEEVVMCWFLSGLVTVPSTYYLRYRRCQVRVLLTLLQNFAR